MKRNNVRIDNPCSEKWETMQEVPGGKFCEACSKNVFDFTGHTHEEIADFLKGKNEDKICGRISLKPFSKIGIGLVLIANLSFAQVQVNSDLSSHKIEEESISTTMVSGKLIQRRTKEGIADAEIFFISRKKIIKAVSDKEGNFILNIPNKLLKKKNILHIDFRKLSEAKKKEKGTSNSYADDYEDETFIFSRDERMTNKKYLIGREYVTIGGVAVTNDLPPNYYYFDGKGISERKYNKLREGFPDYQSFFFYDKEVVKVINGVDPADGLYLLYSN